MTTKPLLCGYDTDKLEAYLKTYLPEPVEKLIRFAMEEPTSDKMLLDLQTHFELDVAQALTALYYTDQRRFKRLLDIRGKSHNHDIPEKHNDTKFSIKNARTVQKPVSKLADYLKGVKNPPYVGQELMLGNMFMHDPAYYTVVKVSPCFVWIMKKDEPNKIIKRKMQRSFDTWYIKLGGVVVPVAGINGSKENS